MRGMRMSTPHWTEQLIALNACPEAVEWARGYRSAQTAWDACERGDWMLWVCGRLSGPPESASRRKLVLTACACARTALRYAPADERRPRSAILTTERWARGTHSVTLDMVRDAAASAASAAVTK